MPEQFYQESNTFAEVNHVLVLVEAVGRQVIGIDMGPGVGKVFWQEHTKQCKYSACLLSVLLLALVLAAV